MKGLVCVNECGLHMMHIHIDCSSVVDIDIIPHSYILNGISQDRCLPFILVPCSATVCERKGSLSSIHVHSHSVMSKLYQAYILYHDTNYIDEMIPELLNHINARADSSTCIKALRPIFFSMSHSRHFMILLKIIRHGVSCSLVRHIDTLYLGPI